MQGDFVVYMVKNVRGVRYIGITSDLLKRLEQHNDGRSQYTRNKGLWRLAWQSKKLCYSEARRLENKMKKQKGGDGLNKLLGLWGS